MDGEIRPIYLYRPSFVVQERSILLTLNSVILKSTQTTTPSPCPLAVGVPFIQSPLRGVLYIIVSRLSNYNKIRLKLAGYCFRKMTLLRYNIGYRHARTTTRTWRFYRL